MKCFFVPLAICIMKEKIGDDMGLKLYNMKHAGPKCPVCKGKKTLLRDDHHGLVFCTSCGSVLQKIHVSSLKPKKKRN